MAAPASRIVRYAPDKGSFPLDHQRLCKIEMSKYMSCIRMQGNGVTAPCEELTKAYLACRMNNGLMDPEPMSDLGFNATPVVAKERKVEAKRETKGFVAGMKR